MTSSEGVAFGPEACAWCAGRGREYGGSTCRVCKGKGAVMVKQPARKCPACYCTGRSECSALEPCEECGGAGWEAVRPRQAQGG